MVKLHSLKQCSPREVEQYAGMGLVIAADMEGYKCAWRNSTYRFSEVYEEHEGHDPECCPIVASLPDPNKLVAK